MKRLKNALFVLLAIFSFSTTLYAQGSGWTVNPHDYQYDMTLYVALTIDGSTVTDYTNYEVAAFVGDECRGVATPDSKDGNVWLYLRVRSNNESGETVTFKVYDKEKDRVSGIEETVEFASQGLVGQPSSPKELTPKKYTPGDVNNDGEINIVDVTSCIQIMAGKISSNYIVDAADVNGDGEINIVDVTSIIQIMAGK